MSQLTNRLNGLQSAILQKEERKASGEKEPCTIDLIRADKEKALSIINNWRKNAVLYGKKQAVEDCNFLIKFLNKLMK